ncbi:MAG: GspE/PulE family protein [Patescibacteria group bacterium]
MAKREFNVRAVQSILVREDYITSQDVAKAENYAKTYNASPLEYYLSSGVLTEELLGQALAEAFNVTFVDLLTNLPDATHIQLIPKETSEALRIVVYKIDDQTVTLATDDPTQLDINKLTNQLFPDRQLKIVYALPSAIDFALATYRSSLDSQLQNLFSGDALQAPEGIQIIVSEAILHRASDIHFEPSETEVILRYRIDGMLHEMAKLKHDFFDLLVNRIKVMSRLRIDEHMTPQDGAMRMVIDNKPVDLRVSCVPMLDGEKIVMRVLAQYVKDFSLQDIGLLTDHQTKIKEALKKPYGMVLTTGPTGSGKTTTLYALIKLLNTPYVNITTIEDPVEYKISGVNQMQVNNIMNVTFSTGLRSLMRQDPDVILLGEVRDFDSANNAVNAALTGHLMFSTFHANDAATTIPHLQEMGIEPFLLASALELIIAQRLVRKICSHCRISYVVPRKSLKPIVRAHYGSETATLYRGKGCVACNQLGYMGRVPVFEMIQMTSEMRDLVLNHASSEQIWELALQQGSQSFFSDGMKKVNLGLTTLEELLRVIPTK